ncbi:MAG: ATP-binding protein [Nanoarchaeota archaeon]
MKKLLEYKNPLYGRRDLSIKLDYLSFFDSKKFFNLDIEEIIKIYGITDGVPLYLRLFKKFKDVKDLAFNKFGFLYQEIDFLLSSEFKEFANYKLILSAIAKGKNTFNEISNYTGIQKSNLFIYLENLPNTELIERVIPVNESIKTKKSKYFIKDNYMNSYFNFIEKYKNYIELDNLNFYEKFLEEYNTYLGLIFEKIAKEFILKKFNNKITKLGKWWYKDREIDLIGLNEQNKEVYFFEIKWGNLSLNKIKGTIKDLKEKSRYFNWKNKKRKEYCCIIAKSINEKAKGWLRENGYFGFELKDFN